MKELRNSDKIVGRNAEETRSRGIPWRRWRGGSEMYLK